MEYKYELINRIINYVKSIDKFNKSRVIINLLKNYIFYTYASVYNNIIYVVKDIEDNSRSLYYYRYIEDNSNDIPLHYERGMNIWENAIPLYYELECMNINELERIIFKNML